MTVGLVAASAALIAQSTAHGIVLAGITALSAAATLTTRMHPLAVLALGAAIGLTGLGQG